MGLDNMRGSYGRCPPFLVGGLLVICVILTFNWWSLSSQNYDLIKQLEDLGEQLRIRAEEHELHLRQKLSFEGRIKNMEEEMAQLRVRLDQQRVENDDVKKQLGEREEELKTANKNKDEVQSTTVRCNTELESLKKLDISKDGAIASLRLEKDRLSTQLEEQKQEVSKLRAEVEQVHIEVSALKLAAKPPNQDKQLLKVSTDGNGDTNADEPDLGQLEDVDRMEVGNEENEDPSKKDNTDTLARNIAQ